MTLTSCILRLVPTPCRNKGLIGVAQDSAKPLVVLCID